MTVNGLATIRAILREADQLDGHTAQPNAKLTRAGTATRANQDTMQKLETKPGVECSDLLGRVSNLARDAMTTHGEHHKQWYLAMILKEVDAKSHYDYEQWGIDMGIAP
jgi:hypothetical protein